MGLVDIVSSTGLFRNDSYKNYIRGTEYSARTGRHVGCDICGCNAKRGAAHVLFKTSRSEFALFGILETATSFSRRNLNFSIPIPPTNTEINTAPFFYASRALGKLNSVKYAAFL